MPKKIFLPPLPPLSLLAHKAVQRLEESTYRDFVNCCWGLSNTQEIEMLRTFVVAVFGTKFAYYRSLQGYREEWISEIRSTTVATAVRILSAMRSLSADESTEVILVLFGTIDDHLETEIQAKTRNIPKQPPPPSVKPIGQQLEDLRNECRLTVEEMAAILKLNLRSVYRNLSGETQPRIRQIAAYEKLFSGKLGRPIRLNTPSKK